MNPWERETAVVSHAAFHEDDRRRRQDRQPEPPDDPGRSDIRPDVDVVGPERRYCPKRMGQQRQGNRHGGPRLREGSGVAEDACVLANRCPQRAVDVAQQRQPGDTEHRDRDSVAPESATRDGCGEPEAGHIGAGDVARDESEDDPDPCAPAAVEEIPAGKHDEQCEEKDSTWTSYEHAQTTQGLVASRTAPVSTSAAGSRPAPSLCATRAAISQIHPIAASSAPTVTAACVQLRVSGCGHSSCSSAVGHAMNSAWSCQNE